MIQVRSRNIKRLRIERIPFEKHIQAFRESIADVSKIVWRYSVSIQMFLLKKHFNLHMKTYWLSVFLRNKKEVYRNITLFNHWTEKNMRDKSSIIINNKIKLSNRFRCLWRCFVGQFFSIFHSPVSYSDNNVNSFYETTWIF